MNNYLKVFLVLLGLLVLISLAAFGQMANSLDKNKILVDIPPGSSAVAIQNILEEKGVLGQHSGFARLAGIFGVASHIQAGQYEFSPSQPLLSVLWQLRIGKVADTSRILVVFPEGSSIYKMGEILRQKGYQHADNFQALVKEGITSELRQRHWATFKYIPSESLEGYLYPDTYWFFINASPEVLAETMVSRFDAVILSYWQQVSAETTYSLHEILTLASIIEKEAKKPEERPIIASVFYNRLKKGMPLAADPTIKYALERPSKKVYYNQLEVDSLYNTYKRRGLPPGPICNPGIESFKAAVHPAKTDFFFFVAKKDGTHIFSKTWAEHQKAIGQARL